MDLDRFKEVNDTFGHRYGDLLLQQVGPRVQGVLEEPETVARLGGDEFAVLLPEVDEEGAARAAERILRALEEPFELAGYSMVVDASIGITLFPRHGDAADTLLRRADVAMYVAKRDDSGYAFYDAEKDEYSPGRLALIGELRRAIEQDQLYLHYQPKVYLKNRELAGVEALVRWEHPERGFVSPDQFIGLAEHTGLIKPLTLWVLNRALEQCHLWQESGVDMTVAVNLSARNLHDPSLVAGVAELLERWELGPGRLEAELTESAVMADPARARETLMGLHEMGVRISIDDFGTGHSSLAYLQQLPVDEIKIDRSFLLDLEENDNDRRIVQATVRLGHDLGLMVVAEGVENQVIWDLLADLGCDVVQGYYVSRPLPAQECTRWLRERRSG